MVGSRCALALVCSLLAACTESGLPEVVADGGEVVDGGGPGPGDGEVTLPDGGGFPGPAHAPLQVDCRHVGSGRDIQVGNPVVETGARIVQVATPGDVDWNRLVAGDTVRIFHRATPYANKILISTSGTAAQPVRVCGVAGPGGELPTITGRGATTRTDLRLGILEPLGIVTIYAPRYEDRAEHVVIEGLRIADTLDGQGMAADALHYTGTDGADHTYSLSSACLRIQEGAHIVIRGNQLQNCGNGLFVLARVPEVLITRDVLIEGNSLVGNGTAASEGIHQAYVQGIDVTVQFNHFGELRPGARGNNLKIRVAGDIVRYNVFDNGARVLDFVEVEDHVQWVIPEHFAQFRQVSPGEATTADEALMLAAWQHYQVTYCYGNIIRNRGARGATNLVHYSFDNTQNDRRPGTLYFFHNTVVVESDFSARAFVRLLDQGPYWGNSGPAVTNNTFAGYATVRAFDNVIVLAGATAGAQKSYWEFTRYRADKLALGKNFISAGWDAAVPGYQQMFPGYGNALVDNAAYVYPGGNDTHHVTGVTALVTGAAAPLDPVTLQPVAGGVLLGAEPLPAEVAAEHRPEYWLDPVTYQPVRRTAWTTLGAIEAR